MLRLSLTVDRPSGSGVASRELQRLDEKNAGEDHGDGTPERRSRGQKKRQRTARQRHAAQDSGPMPQQGEGWWQRRNQK